MTAACERLNAYLDGRLPDEARAAFEAHVSACGDCARAVAAWARTTERLETWAAPFAGPPSAQQLRQFRGRFDSPPKARWVPVLVGAMAAAAVALGVGLALQRPGATEWDISGGAAVVVDRTVALGSADSPQHYRIGPDALELAASTEVSVVEKGVKRTRLVLRRGVLKAHVDPGRQGREFVVESPPYRISVVGTVFVVQRKEDTLRVATSKGQVRVEQLGPEGKVVNSQLVSSGDEVHLGPPPTEVADAGAPEAEPVDAGPPPRASQPRVDAGPKAATLRAWRQRAARGECDSVFEETQVALTSTPSHVGTLRVHADCARKMGMSAAAVDAYRRVIALASGAEAAEARLLAASLLQEQLHDAPGVLEVTRTTAGASPPVAAALHVRRARALLLLGRKAEARQEVELTLTRFQTTPAAAEALRLKAELGP